MIYGYGAFVTPGDSVAIIADKAAECIPYFKKGGIHGLARSMPTSAAIDLVAKAKGLKCYEVPTGWKFFGNLMDAGKLSICGEESFGTGSDHVREKDGLWAVVAWLNIAAYQSEIGQGCTIGEIVSEHHKVYGRNFFSRYDYEDVSSEGAKKLVENLNHHLAEGKSSFIGCKHTGHGEEYTIKDIVNFSYTDPIDGSVSKNQGHLITFSDGSRIVFRLSGTGSQGATVRMYVEKYTKDPSLYGLKTADGLKGLIQVAQEISKLKEYLHRDEPTVIT